MKPAMCKDHFNVYRLLRSLQLVGMDKFIPMAVPWTWSIQCLWICPLMLSCTDMNAKLNSNSKFRVAVMLAILQLIHKRGTSSCSENDFLVCLPSHTYTTIQHLPKWDNCHFFCSKTDIETLHIRWLKLIKPIMASIACALYVVSDFRKAHYFKP